MSNIKFFYDNFFTDYDITPSSEHENFPATNLQLRDFNTAWRSLYGAGSGWGTFLVDSNNNKIDFEETAASELTATLTGGTYDIDTYIAEIETQLESAGASGYTVSYDEVTRKITTVSDGVGGGGILNLLTSTGTNAATSAYGDMGYDTTSDKTGALTYEASYARIHTHESLYEDFGAAKAVDGVMVRGHNLSDTAVLKVEFSTNDFATTAESLSFTVQDDLMVLEWDTAKTYRYIRIWLEDPDNTYGYVSLGYIFAGDQFQPESNYQAASMYWNPIDPSDVLVSEGGQESSLQFDHYEIRSYVFRVKGSTEIANFKAMFAACGTSKPLFVCEDPDAPSSTTHYVAFGHTPNSQGWRWEPVNPATDHYRLTIDVREMR